MRKTEETDVCKKNVVFFSGVCINMCSIPSSAAQAAVMRTAKNSTVQKKKNIHENSYNRDFRRNHKKKKVKSGGSVILPVEVNKRDIHFWDGQQFPDRPVINVSGIPENSGYEKYSSLSGEV